MFFSKFASTKEKFWKTKLTKAHEKKSTPDTDNKVE
jgi:hypothetical protein